MVLPSTRVAQSATLPSLSRSPRCASPADPGCRCSSFRAGRREAHSSSSSRGHFVSCVIRYHCDNVSQLVKRGREAQVHQATKDAMKDVIRKEAEALREALAQWRVSYYFIPDEMLIATRRRHRATIKAFEVRALLALEEEGG